MYQYNPNHEPMPKENTPRQFNKIVHGIKKIASIYRLDPQMHLIECIITSSCGTCYPAIITVDNLKRNLGCIIKLRGRNITSNAMIKILLRLQDSLNGTGTVTFDEENNDLKVRSKVPFADADNVQPVISTMLNDVQNILQNETLRLLTN